MPKSITSDKPSTQTFADCLAATIVFSMCSEGNGFYCKSKVALPSSTECEVFSNKSDTNRTKGATERQDFFWFWRNIGRSGKTGDDLGRWGLGKTVYRAASRVGCMFGLTIRKSDGRELLMGQPRRFSATIELPDNGWPQDAVVVMEAMCAGSPIVKRFNCGTIGNLASPRDVALEGINGQNVFFALKVIDHTERIGRLLGVVSTASSTPAVL